MTVSREIDRVDLASTLWVLRDDSAALGITDIIKPEVNSRFIPLGGKSGFGYTSDVLWFKFTARNTSEKSIAWYLEYAYAATDHFEFFHPEGRDFTVYKGGDCYPFDIRPVNFRTVVVPVILPPGDHTFYFNVKSRGAVVVPVRAWGQEAFERHRHIDAALNWVYYGVMLATSIYCLLVFASMGARSFLFLFVFVAGSSLFTMVHTGIAFQYLWPDTPSWNNVFHPLSGTLGALGALLFTRSFLNTRVKSPLFDRVLIGWLMAGLALFGLIFFLPYQVATQAMVILCGFSVLSIIAGSLVLVIRGMRRARYFIFAWSPFILSSVLLSLKSYGLIENSLLIESMVQITGAMVTILLSFGLMDKLNSIGLEREKVLSQLHRSQARYRMLAGNVKDVIWILDLADMKIRYITDSVKEMMGYTPEEARHFSFKEMLTPESADKAMESIQQGMEKSRSLSGRSGHVFTVELECYNKSGDILWTETRTSFTKDQSGRPVEMIGVTRDITARKRAEQENQALESRLRQAGKLEAIGTLAGGIAHDMNNIMAAILGYTELCLGSAEKDSPMAHRLGRIAKACYRARDLVSQILAFSRQDSPEKQIIEPHLIVGEVLKLIRSSLPTFIDIRQDIRDKTLAVAADPIQIHQILMNLCTNAGHAMMEGGGVLGVSVEKMMLDTDTAKKHMDLLPGDYVRLTVSDTGCGMEKEVKDRIFDPFFTTKAVGEGTGMGLSMVHGIVKKLKGSIFVYSEPGKGTTVHVFLPRAAPGVAPGETVCKIDIPGGSETILYVDDEADIAEMAQDMLSALGYSVVVKTKSREALGFISRNPGQVDLMITDQNMPEMTGMDLARKALEEKPGLPIILCTGFSEQVTPEALKASGICQYLPKPYSKREIALRIQKALGRDA